MPIKFLVSEGGGGVFFFFGRGGVEVPILFLWARGFFWTKARKSKKQGLEGQGQSTFSLFIFFWSHEGACFLIQSQQPRWPDDQVTGRNRVSTTFCFSALFWSFPPKTPPHLGIENSHKRVRNKRATTAKRKKCCRHLVPSSDFFVQSFAVPTILRFLFVSLVSIYLSLANATRSILKMAPCGEGIGFLTLWHDLVATSSSFGRPTLDHPFLPCVFA